MTISTRERIMEVARLTVQDLGYSGLSFRELAKARSVGIKSAIITLSFPRRRGSWWCDRARLHRAARGLSRRPSRQKR